MRMEYSFHFGMRCHHFLMQIPFLPFTVGYTTTDVIYRWNQKRQVAIAEDMKLSQFDLVDCPAENVTDTVLHGDMANQPRHKAQIGEAFNNDTILHFKV